MDRHAQGGSETRAPEWREIVDALADPVIALDRDGIVLHLNPPVADVFPNLRRGQPITLVSRNPELLRAIEGVPASGGRAMVELEERVPVRRRLTAIVTGLPRSGGPQHPSVLVALRDMTDQQRTAELRADFISYASHELRTPLASLRSMVETLAGPARNDPAARDRFLAMMLAQAERMSRLIDDLLVLSRAEMQAHVRPTAKVDLVRVAQSIVETLRPLAAESGVSLRLETDDSPAIVRGDAEGLIQVVQNLAQNAIKYGRDGGTVTIRVAAADPETASGRRGRVALSVADDGPGIAPEHLPRLTERFYRVSTAQSRAKGGTGLGLAIVKHVVNRHRGILSIESTLGVGSTFTVVLDSLASAHTSVGSFEGE